MEFYNQQTQNVTFFEGSAQSFSLKFEANEGECINFIGFFKVSITTP